MYSFLFVLTTKAECVPVLYIQFFFQLLGPLPRQSRVTSVNQSCLHSQRASEVFFFFCQCLVSTWALPHVRFLARKFKNSSFLGRLADLGDYFKGFNELSVDFFFNAWEKTDVCQKPKAAYILSGLFNIKGWPLTVLEYPNRRTDEDI